MIHSFSVTEMNLFDLQILALDCQATGANPTKGHLLEIGWIKTRAKDDATSPTLQADTQLVRLPPDVDIPPAVQRVTGLSGASLENSQPAVDVWRRLHAAARDMVCAGRRSRCPTVIHFARFEEPFLRQLHAESDSDDSFPFHIICSHDISRRLLPGLPRKGLRAVAGYFGHSVPPLRRAGEHAIATAFIWQHLVRQLHVQHGIEHLEQLLDWLKHPPGPGRLKREFPMNPETRRNLPNRPGVYRMRRSNGDLLYIGKATSLRQRVNSYFHQKAAMGEHTLEMISQAADLDVTLTGSALEAAVLESDEIKRHAPPYNVALQKGERRLIFCTRDCRRFADKPDSEHCIGPLPDGNLTAAMAAFSKWHTANSDRSHDDLLQIGKAATGIPEAYAPPPDCLAEGLDLFRDNHLRRYRNYPPLRAISALGFSLWQERLAARQQAQQEAVEKDEEETVDQALETQPEPTWTPEAVSRSIEHAVMHSALLIRRSRWLSMLSESTLAWEARDSAVSAKNVLVLESGTVFRSMQLPMEEQAPAPAGCTNRITDRQKYFDVATYERLRVVTTELRRLAASDRQIEITLTPTARLNRRHLSRLLPWV